MPERVSMLTEDMSDSSGLLNDQDVEIIGAKYEIFTFGGKGDPIPCLMVTYKFEDENGEDKEHTEAYGCGKQSAENFKPSPDGDDLHHLPGRGHTQVNKNTKAGVFYRELEQVGVSDDLRSGQASMLIGIRGHVIRRAESFKNDKGTQTDYTNLIFDFLEASEPKKAKKKRGKGKTKAKAEAAAPDSDALQAAIDLVSSCLEEEDSITVAGVMGHIAEVDSAIQGDVVKLLYTSDFQSDESRPWDFDKDTFTVE